MAQRVVGAGIEVRVERDAADASCPHCHRRVTKVHDRRWRPKQDEPLGTRPVTVVVLRRRLRCPWDNRVFTEPELEVGGWRRRTTHRLRDRVGRAGGHQPVQHVATHYGMSPTTGERAVHEQAATAGVLPTRRTAPVLALDDFSRRRGRRYATGFHDLARERVLDVVDGRTADRVVAALERLVDPDAVAVVSMDMARAYRAAVRLVCPAATITVDKFPVITRVQEAVTQVWRRLVRGKRREDPLRQAGRLVLRNREALTDAEGERLRPLLRQDPDLRQAWLLKEDCRRWYRSAIPATARLELAAWERHLRASAIPNCERCRACCGTGARRS